MQGIRQSQTYKPRCIPEEKNAETKQPEAAATVLLLGQAFLRFCVVFLSPSEQMLGYHRNLGHYRFLPYTFHFIIHVSHSHSTLFNLSCGKLR
jgi:hypothetical protein